MYRNIFLWYDICFKTTNLLIVHDDMKHEVNLHF